MMKSPDWLPVYDLMKAGKRQTPWGDVCFSCVSVCVCAGMTEMEGEGEINRASAGGKTVCVCV